MTASDLYEIVRDVPREAWPEQMAFNFRRQMFTNEIEPSPRWDLTPDWAANAFVGSMTAWLIHRGRLTLRGNVFAGVVSYAIVEIEPIEPTGANTLVAALAATCKEIGA